MRAEKTIVLTKEEQETLSKFYNIVSELNDNIDVEELLIDICLKNEKSIANNVTIVYER